MEPICITYSLHYTAHEYFDGSGTWVLLLGVLAVSLVVVEPQEVSEFVLLKRLLHVNFVAEYDEGHILQLGHGKQIIKLFLHLWQSLFRRRVYHKDYPV